MKKKELNNIKNKSAEELLKDLMAKREALAKLRFDLSSGKVKNVKEIRETKRSIAQIKTLITGKKVSR